MSCPELTGRHVWMGELMVTRTIALGKKAAGKWARLVAVLGAVLAPVAFVAPAASASGGVSASGGTAATTDTSPVNLSANINMAAGRAAQRATVAAGDARFEVLAPDVIRLGY